jgi:hypothetical protein
MAILLTHSFLEVEECIHRVVDLKGPVISLAASPGRAFVAIESTILEFAVWLPVCLFVVALWQPPSLARS